MNEQNRIEMLHLSQTWEIAWMGIEWIGELCGQQVSLYNNQISGIRLWPGWKSWARKIIHNKWFYVKFMANVSYKLKTVLKNSVSFVKVSCWQMTFAQCLTLLFWHPVCQHVCDCMNAHGVSESISGNTTHSLSCSRLSPTGAHIQHDCLTKVSGKLKISPRAESTTTFWVDARFKSHD